MRHARTGLLLRRDPGARPARRAIRQRQRRTRLAQDPRTENPRAARGWAACRLPPVKRVQWQRQRSTYRRAEEADLPRALRGVSRGAQRVPGPAGQTPVPEEDDQSPAYRHYLRHDAERFWVARGRDGEDRRLELRAAARGLVVPQQPLRAAGGAGTWRRRPALRARGTGAPAGAVRATVTDSMQPISNTLYAHRGAAAP